MYTHTFRAMNTDVLLAAEIQPAAESEAGVRGHPGSIRTAFREVEALVRDYEQRFTRFTDYSELAALNRSAGGWYAASPEMIEVVSLALEMYHATGRLFDPGILADLEAAGYDRSMDAIRASGGLAGDGRPPAAFRLPRVHADFGQTRIETRLGAIRLPNGLRIDLGGIAKGWIGQRAAEKLALFAGAAMVDAGGDLYACGLPHAGDSWTVAIENPLSPQEDAAVIQVGPGAVATSTTTRRRWKQAGQTRHHLIDPATGLPAESQWISVTAVLPQNANRNVGGRAEALAKAMLIAGPARADDLMRAHPGSYFIAIDRAGKVWRSLLGEPARHF